MEDALVLHLKGNNINNVCVLILVLMEDALVQKYNGTNESYFEVLILVLMEDALVQYIRDYLSKRELRS